MRHASADSQGVKLSACRVESEGIDFDKSELSEALKFRKRKRRHLQLMK